MLLTDSELLVLLRILTTRIRPESRSLQLPIQGVLKDGLKFFGQCIFKPENFDFIPRFAVNHIDLCNELGNFTHIARTGLHDDGVASVVRNNPQSCPQAGAITLLNRAVATTLTGATQAEIKFVQSTLGILRRDVLKPKGLEFGIGLRRDIKFLQQVFNEFDRFFSSDEQDGVWLAKSSDRHRALTCLINVVVQFLSNRCDGGTVDILQVVVTDFGLRLVRKIFNLFNQSLNTCDILRCTFDNDDSQLFDKLKLDRPKWGLAGSVVALFTLTGILSIRPTGFFLKRTIGNHLSIQSLTIGTNCWRPFTDHS